MAAVSTRVPLEFHCGNARVPLAWHRFPPEFYWKCLGVTRVLLEVHRFCQSFTAMLLAAPEFYWHGIGFHQSSTGISLWQRQSFTGMASVSTRVLLEVPWCHQSSTGVSSVFTRHRSTAMLLAAPEFYRSFIRFHQSSTGSSLWQRQWQRWAAALAG